MKPLWSALCCSVPEGPGGFSVGLIREAGKGQRQVSVKELEELLGVQELFSEGCGRTDETVADVVEIHSKGNKDDGDVSDEAITDKNGDPSVATGEEGEADEVTEGATAGSLKSVRSRGKHSGAVSSDSIEFSADYETVDDKETDTNSSSIVLFVLSTTFSILTAPLRPVLSTVTRLPGQVILSYL